MEMNKKLKLNVFSFILFTIFIITLLTDYLTYFINANYLISLIISTIISGIIYFFLRKKIKIETDFQKWDIIFFVLLIGIFTITIVYPDISFDTINYHVYLQENPFGDKIFSDFFAGKNLNSFSYAFPDRIHYIFRYFLGYRFGVLCNYLIIITLYYQAKKLLKNLLKESNSAFVCIMASLAVFSLSIVELIDNYYIDLFSLVVIFNIVNLILFDTFEDDKKYNLLKVNYLAALFGFAIAIKISNIPALVILLIIFFIKTKFKWKKLNLKIVLTIILSGIIPFIIYLVYTYLKTGNPVFPFYNTIFKSEYYSLSNWMDTRFGPANILESIIWPIKIVFYPIRGVDSAIVEPMWMFGYIASIVYLVYFLVKKIKKENINQNKGWYFLIVFLINIVWAKLQLGYTRYGLIVLLLSNISFGIVLYDCHKYKKYICMGLLSIFLLYNYSYSSYHFMHSKEYWLFNNTYQQDRGIDYINNLKKNYSKQDYKIEIPENGVWAIINYNAAYATMLNNNISTINLNSGVSNAKTENILNQLIENKRLFTITDVLNFNNFITYLNESGYYINSYYDTVNPSFMRYRERLFIFEIEKSNQNNSYESVNTFKEITCEEEMCNNFSFIAGLEKSLIENMTEGYLLEVEITNNDKKEVIDYINLEEEGKLITYTKNLKMKKGDKIKLTIVTKEKEKFLDDRWFMIINPILN